MLRDAEFAFRAEAPRSLFFRSAEPRSPRATQRRRESLGLCGEMRLTRRITPASQRIKGPAQEANPSTDEEIPSHYGPGTVIILDLPVR